MYSRLYFKDLDFQVWHWFCLQSTEVLEMYPQEPHHLQLLKKWVFEGRFPNIDICPWDLAVNISKYFHFGFMPVSWTNINFHLGYLPVSWFNLDFHHGILCLYSTFISIMDIYRCRCGSLPFGRSQLRARALRQMLCSSSADSVKIHAIYTLNCAH